MDKVTDATQTYPDFMRASALYLGVTPILVAGPPLRPRASTRLEPPRALARQLRQSPAPG